LDYVGTLANAAVVISRLYRGEKRLVFCDSRSRVEELGSELRSLGVSTFLSHSSLSVEERKMAEDAFAQAQDCVIVATSTLELGIDVGDLDRVIQIDAPSTVASFLQRLGRTGRRKGSRRNCLLLATSDNALLRAAALLELWETGFVEPVKAPEHPLHLFAQQVMALSLQEHGIGQHDWKEWIGRLPAFSTIPSSEIEAITTHLLDRTILFSDGIRLSFGDEGQSLFGRRHFLELVSVFTSPPLFNVLHGRKELGSVHQIAFVRHRPEEPAVLSLGGRSWMVTSLDWLKRTAYVIPAEQKGKSRWLSTHFGLSFIISQAIHQILTTEQVSSRWSSRAREKMESLRDDHDFLKPDSDTLLVSRDQQSVQWFTFAGNIHNLAIADALRVEGEHGLSVNDFTIRWNESTDHHRILAAIENLTSQKTFNAFRIPEEFMEQLKFNECLPHPLTESLLRNRLLQKDSIQTILKKIRLLILN
jgi:ATP-dependent Lhr-like helicase